MHAELGAGGGVVAPVAAAEQLRRPVAGVDRAAREHVGAAHELDRDVAPQHEHLQLRRVTDEHHGGGLPRGHHRNASESGPVEGSLASRTSTPVYVASREFPASYARAPNYAGDVDPRRALPGVDQVLAALSGLPHELLVAVRPRRHRGRTRADDARPGGGRRLGRRRDGRCRGVASSSSRTGSCVPSSTPPASSLHTNLGRAPIGDDALAAARAIGRGYSNLEYRLDDRRARLAPRARRRAARPARAAPKPASSSTTTRPRCCSSLAALARGREVVVSRGELVEIGGGFRVPEIMAESGCRLVEVGTTNRTRRADYERAVCAPTPRSCSRCTRRTTGWSASPRRRRSPSSRRSGRR